MPVVSWLIEHDVSEGRAQLNFSTWHDYTTFERADLLDKVCDKATKREMPLWQYRLLHRESWLNASAVAADSSVGAPTGSAIGARVPSAIASCTIWISARVTRVPGTTVSAGAA